MTTQPLEEVKPDPLIGQRLGDFVVEQPLAAGGMGVVYRAKHPLIGRLAAIKVLKPEFATDTEQTDRFLKEAQALSAIKHRGIIEIIGFGNTSDGRQYMTTEFLDGEPLDAVLAREAPMPALRVLGLCDEILHALSAAHKSGVVHRDLKPSNVFLAVQSTGERIVKLLDFGLAKQNPVTLAQVSDGVLAKASLVAGTPEYIAPEQARGFAPTPRTDLYCLGVMMFEMLSGTLPFKAVGVVDMLKKHVYEAPPKLASRVSNLPEAVYELVDAMLEKDPEKRPGSAELVRQQVLRLTRQLQAENTVQRPNPILVVPAPFRMAGPDAPTPPLDKKNIVTEPVLRTPTADKLENELKKGPNRKPLYAAIALLFLAVLVYWLWPRGTQTPEPIAEPKPAPPPVELAKAPEPAPAPAPAPLPVIEETEPLPSLPTAMAKAALPKRDKQLVAIIKPPPQVALSANDRCANLESWRQEELDRADDISTVARARLMEAGRTSDDIDKALKSLAPVKAKINATKNGNDCIEATRQLTAWATEHGL
ncbi:MAG: serine/threonine protein kinase [Myxococcaceae bacterium]|nr:serine/threonine protein kinase [Myxococcaceae bacterium]